MSFVLQTLLDALSVGSLYALSALAIGLLFGVMRLINFAQAEFMTVAIYVLLASAPLAFGVSALLALVAVVALALVSERIAFRPVRAADPATLLVTSFALSYFLQNALVVVFGARPLGLDVLPALTGPMTVAGLRIARLNVVTVLVTLALLAAVALLLNRTRIGVQMRAAAVDFRMARLLGVSADRVIATAFLVSGALAAVAGILFAAQTGTVSPTIGLKLAIVGFVATVIGGMGSLVGAVAGGFFVGFVSIALQALLPAELRPFRDAFVFALVIVVLSFRPGGLFRSGHGRDRV